MTCGNKFCIYWSNNSCILKQVNLDCQGSCINCILIEPTDEYLEQKRRELLDKLDERYVRLQERMQEDGYPFLPDQS
ncbi:MAG: hypothetical protein HFF99_01660 [Oscillibacter sp.]|nr:hypothetical protein [uncultured Oscillibacter sp.]MCI8970146.1 hypothetical protein [Oscillibacter sp.]